jgi:hypothetical protein
MKKRKIYDMVNKKKINYIKKQYNTILIQQQNKKKIFN